MLVAVGDEGEAPAGIDNNIIIIRHKTLLHIRQTDLHLFKVWMNTITNTTEIGHEPDAVANANRSGLCLLNENENENENENSKE